MRHKPGSRVACIRYTGKPRKTQHAIILSRKVDFSVKQTDTQRPDGPRIEEAGIKKTKEEKNTGYGTG